VTVVMKTIICAELIGRGALESLKADYEVRKGQPPRY
jgi:hypothetical protein